MYYQRFQGTTLGTCKKGFIVIDVFPKLLGRLKCEFKLKTMEESRVGAHSLACSTLEG
jgi:hypothetical protein